MICISRKTERRQKQNINSKKKTYVKTLSRKLYDDSKEFFNGYQNDITRQAYLKNYRRFIDFCRETYDCSTKEECGLHIQDYSDALVNENGYTASTIHTYLAPVCAYHNVSMKSIEKPIRHTADNIRSRNKPPVPKRSDADYDNSEFAYAVKFQEKVGIRRAELMRLRKDDFVQDESGYWCVRVKRGKGGKFQLQRIHPKDVEYIKQYFTGGSGKVFVKSDLPKNMDFHYLRAKHSQEMYRYYKELIDSSPEARQKCRRELFARWNMYNKDPKTGKSKYLDHRKLEGTYQLRGDNRKYALQHGLPTEYDKLAVMMVSVFHLSHWRLDTLCNYFLNPG